jgi:putative ABC transport system substrate-binding protein
MRRRDVLLISVASIGWPSVASTQSAGRRRIGVIVLGGTYHAGVAGLRAGLEAAGLDEGSVALDIRDAHGELARIQAAAKELEREGVDVIVVFGTSGALAVKATTTSVPVVFAVGGDPVGFGLVESIAKPGGRFTGLHTSVADLKPKRLQLLREIVPTLRRVVTLYNLENRVARSALASAQVAARELGLEVVS